MLVLFAMNQEDRTMEGGGDPDRTHLIHAKPIEQIHPCHHGGRKHQTEEPVEIPVEAQQGLPRPGIAPFQKEKPHHLRVAPRRDDGPSGPRRMPVEEKRPADPVHDRFDVLGESEGVHEGIGAGAAVIPRAVQDGRKPETSEDPGPPNHPVAVAAPSMGQEDDPARGRRPSLGLDPPDLQEAAVDRRDAHILDPPPVRQIPNRMTGDAMDHIGQKKTDAKIENENRQDPVENRHEISPFNRIDPWKAQYGHNRVQIYFLLDYSRYLGYDFNVLRSFIPIPNLHTGEGLMDRVLLLNITYEPLKIINWRKAVTLLSLGKVEVLEEYGREIHSVSFQIKLPAVVRLLRLVRRPPKPVKFSRQNIYARDKYACQYCGETFTPEELTYDHVIPRSRGGKTEWGNIVSCCVECNRRKGGRTPQEAGMRLVQKPCRPKWLPVLKITIGIHEVPTSWRDYLYWNMELME